MNTLYFMLGSQNVSLYDNLFQEGIDQITDWSKEDLDLVEQEKVYSKSFNSLEVRQAFIDGVNLVGSDFIFISEDEYRHITNR